MDHPRSTAASPQHRWEPLWAAQGRLSEISRGECRSRREEPVSEMISEGWKSSRVRSRKDAGGIYPPAGLDRSRTCSYFSHFRLGMTGSVGTAACGESEEGSWGGWTKGLTDRQGTGAKSARHALLNGPAFKVDATAGDGFATWARGEPYLPDGPLRRLSVLDAVLRRLANLRLGPSEQPVSP